MSPAIIRHVAAETDHVLATRDSRGCSSVRDAISAYRVVQADGTLGGYAGPHTWMKELLPRLEGCPIVLRRGVPVVAHDALWGAVGFMLHAR